MEETRFYQKPWFYIVSRGFIMLVLYGIAIYYQWRGNNFEPITIFVDIALLIFLLLIWLAFFAQFVLPVRTFEERQKIFDRLLGYLGGSRGPALFIKNGKIIDRPGESEREGPGVLWLDSASAAVTHINTAFKNTIGPGVNFTDKGEKIVQANVVDLHVQTQRIGPWEREDPFALQGGESKDEYEEIQKRRMMTSAWTRDGIEVVPNISVTFKIDADPIQGDLPGSHFGFKEESVTRAIINQAINPNAKPNTLAHNVAWNELPAYIAADLWREFMSKFRLGQLFKVESIPPLAIPLPSPIPSVHDTNALYLPLSGREQSAILRVLTEMLHELNYWLGGIADRCEKDQEKNSAVPARAGSGGKPPNVSKKTALQVINFMIKERMTNPKVPLLDQNGERLPGSQESNEFRLLQEHGIRVISVNVGNLRFPSKVEGQLISQWTANWLVNARKERERIQSRQRLSTLSGQEQAIRAYADALSPNLAALSKRKEVLKTLILRSRDILIRNDRIHRRATSELEGIAEILQWLEEN